MKERALSEESYKMRQILLLFLLLVVFITKAQTFLIDDFESTSRAYVAWNGSCEQIDNPFMNSDNNSSKVLKIISNDYAPVGFPLDLPEGKTLNDYTGIRFQAAILEEISESSIHWIGFNVGVSENQHTMQLVDPAEGNGAAWTNGQLGKWYSVDLLFDQSKLQNELSLFVSGAVNAMIKLGRKQFIYLVDNVQLIEKKTYVGNETVNFMGVNLAGGEFGGVFPGIDGTNYGYPTYKDLDYFNSKGLKLIRLPFRWERVQYTMNGALTQSEITKIKNFVKAAEDRGMPIILDMHNFARYSFDGGTTYTVIGQSQKLTKEHLADVWKKLAMEFKDYNNIWGYDIMNEPYDMPYSNAWFEIAQETINAIREIDTLTPIVVSGDGFSSSLRWLSLSDNLRNLYDPSNNLIFQAHTYFDRDQSGVYAGSYDNEGTTPQTGVERIKPFVDWLKKYNKKGILGEYGIPDNDSRWLIVLENTLKYLVENGISGTYWAAGPRWGNYKLAVHPSDNYTVDRPQMAVLSRYTKTIAVATSAPANNYTELNEYIGLKGAILFKPATNKEISVFDVLGRKYKTFFLTAGEAIVCSFKPGIYVVDGHKIFVY